ncbi:MAG: DUF4124 domain-containing protein [Gammaproteobacteria bacterium]|nr:DUF4124 domain-containing protein [Gammaproteobacteria bacterium]
MDKRPILLLASLFAASTVMAEAYRWVDADGVVHYSDRPEEGAERIDLPESNIVRVRRYAQPAEAANAAAEPAGEIRYESIAVAAPAAEETLWNIEGVLNVNIALSPALQPGHQLRVYFDGEQRTVSGTSFQIEEVHRGVHNLQAEVVDETGQLKIRSQPNRFYVQQNTIRQR